VKENTVAPTTETMAAGAATAVPQAPPAGTSTVRHGWSARTIAALVVGALMTLGAVALIGTGGVVLWADRTHRDGGYLTSDSQTFSTDGAALVTVPAHLGSPGTGQLYSPGLLGTVRIQVRPERSGSAVFVGIARSADVDRYLAGVQRTVITEFFQNRVRTVSGEAVAAPPGSQQFWVSSASGTGPQTVVWKPTDGSWDVVVMNPDARHGLTVIGKLGARAPALPWIGVGLLAAGVVLLAGGALLVAGAVRRHRAGARA
jgi:hypothetical protein